ncbi:hypothetical protein D3C80_1127110 [compost metagenome]
MPGWTIKKRTAQTGLKALSTSGLWMMPCTPKAPSTTNQVTITGPKRMPMRAVPCFWIRNNATSTINATGMTQ